MLSCLALLLAGPPTLTAPVLPPGCSPDFQRMVISVEQSLKDGAFDVAARKFQLLPKASAVFSWDDSKVPAGQRASFAAARDLAIKAWDRHQSGQITFKPGPSPDIKFSFEPKLANDPSTGSPAGLASFVSETTLPRIEAILGLIRGPESRATAAIDVQNDVEYAIGTYLGVAQDPVPTTSMSKSDAVAIVANIVTAPEFDTAKRNLAAVEVLRSAIHAQVRLQPAQPIASFESTSLTYGPVLQGQQAMVPLMITNIGQGDLTYEVLPECSCITAGPAGSIKPNQSKLIDILVDTAEWSRTLVKKLVVLTNDAENPVRVVPLEVKVNPRYRWIVPGGGARVVDDAGSDINLYLDLPLDSGIFPNGVKFDGVEGTAKLELFSGELADPDHGEGKIQRNGYVVKLHVSGNIIGGRQVGTVTVSTSSELFPQITYNLSFQKGIIAMPDDVNMGMISGGSKTVYVQMTRPGRPFRVLSTATTSKNLTAKASKVSGTDDYLVTISFSGKASPGDYLAVVHVYTDDPRQGKIDIPVRGTLE